MIKLRDFLKIANDPVEIMDGSNNVVLIDDTYFDNDILSQKLLDMEVSTVDAREHRLLVELEGVIR
jgi:hypothetical protein